MARHALILHVSTRVPCLVRPSLGKSSINWICSLLPSSHLLSPSCSSLSGRETETPFIGEWKHQSMCLLFAIFSRDNKLKQMSHRFGTHPDSSWRRSQDCFTFNEQNHQFLVARHAPFPPVLLTAVKPRQEELP